MRHVGYDLLVCDLDGTLIDHSMALDPALVTAFKGAAARGLHISIATGRMPAAVDRYREELDIQTPVIYYNGALIRDPASGRDLLSHRLPPGILGRVVDVFANAPVHPLFFRDDRLYCLELSLAIRGFCEDEGLRVHVIPDPEDFLRLGAFMKSLFIGPPDVLVVLRQDLEAVIGSDARLVRTASHYLELVPAAASKGSALSCLAEHLGVPLPRVVAVGDQDNDLDMICAAGLGVAMPGAPEAVRSAADRVAPPAADGGLVALLAAVLPEHFR